MDERKYLVLTRSKQGKFENTTRRVNQIELSGNKTHVTFLDGKTLPYNNTNVLFFERPIVINVDESIISVKGELNKKWDEALIFNNQYVVLFISGCGKSFPIADVHIIPNIAHQSEVKQLIDYYRFIASFLRSTSPSVNYLYENKLNQIRNDSILSHYVNPSKSLRKEDCLSPIFPFGVNPSQREAVTNALTSKISIIQGPPGTGKTQTILNIIANLVCQNKTVAVVAGNNEAIHNIYEKLAAKGFEFIAASLGNSELQQVFFTREHIIPDVSDWQISEEILLKTKQSITASNVIISELLDLQNQHAEIRWSINRLKLEHSYFNKHFPVEPVSPSRWSFSNKWSTPNLMKFMAEVECSSAKEKLSWPRKFKWLFKYGIYKFKDINVLSDQLFKRLISEYYQRKSIELKERKLDIEEKLNQHNFDDLLRLYSDNSMLILKHHVFSTHHRKDGVGFDYRTYKRFFNDFVKRFPVVLSTTDSIINNKEDHALFDYLIVDEASQVNLLSGVLAMACAKNMVVVGDLQQIPHIPDNSLIAAHPDVDEKFSIPAEYSYRTESLLSSINRVFFNSASSTLLKEHYRCHPRIIDFCNQKYYDGQLVIMTDSESEPFKIFKTVPGHHVCKDPGGSSKINYRELAVIKEELLDVSLNNVAPEKIGIVTPYRAQVTAANEIINKKGLKIDTAHKFQGREKDIIIYSPTADRADSFNDSPNLINVAVSRAKEQFIMVMSDSLFKKQGTNIGDLIRHIEYQSMLPSIFESKIVSIFDCLYREYAPVLHDFKQRVVHKSQYMSENLMATLLDDILADESFTSFTYKHNYPLHLLISDFSRLAEIERKFASNLNSHIDFLIFNKLDKQPLLAIEVDGYSFHALDEQQKERDQIKDSILVKLDIPLLRISTKSSNEKEVIRQALLNIIAFIPELDEV